MLTLADILDRSARSPAPGPRGHPLLGSLPRARRDPIALFMDSFRDYGEVVRFRLGPMVAHLISSPAGVNHVLAENNKYAFATMEAELVLATLAQRLRFDLAPGSGVELEPSITLRPRNGIRMSIR